MKKKKLQKKKNKPKNQIKVTHLTLKIVNTVEDGNYSDFITMLILILEEYRKQFSRLLKGHSHDFG